MRGRISIWTILTCFLFVLTFVLFGNLDFKFISSPKYKEKFVDDILKKVPNTLNQNGENEISRKHEVTFDGLKYLNDTPAPEFLVPNIAHYIRWNKSEYSFVDYICFRSAYVNHKPSIFYIHTNTNFSGKWWNKIQEEADWTRRIKILWLEPPTEIWGQKLSTVWQLPHGSDIERIRLLMKYGGIWFGNDVYVVQNMDYFRRFEMTLAWDQDQFLGTQVLLANKNARFLPLWLDTYKEYHADRWYYNAGERPTVEILYKDPSLVHRILISFGVHMWLPENLYGEFWPEWKSMYTMHLLVNHRNYLDAESWNQIGDFNEVNILTYNKTFGYMARELMVPELFPQKE